MELIFEPVTEKGELVLPTLFAKTVLDKPDPKGIKEFNEYLCGNYIKEDQYKNLLSQIIGVENIPVELLSKYYIQIYTIEGNFYKDMKKKLLIGNEANFKIYKSFIHTLFEGCEKEALKTSITDDIIYSAQFISPDEIQKLIENIKTKEKSPDHPTSLVFSKSFISFTKDEKVAEKFYTMYDKNAMLYVIGYNKSIDLKTHEDIEEISIIPEEREILFFPFSSFGIQRIEKDPNDTNRYNLKLINLGKYIKDFEKNKKLYSPDKTLPNTDFKKYFEESGLSKKDKQEKFNEIKIKDVFTNYENYKSSKSKCSKKWWFLALFGLLGLFGLIKLKSDDGKCKKNYYLDVFSKKCLTCDAGYYSNGGEPISCSRCPYGQSSSGDGSDCFNCSAGTTIIFWGWK